MKIIGFLGVMFLPVLVFAQGATGRVIESNSADKGIPFAKIHFVDLETTIYADSLGNWSINELPQGPNHIIVSAVGYETLHTDINPGDKPAVIQLHTAHHQLDKVIVSNLGLLHRESITNVESRSISELNNIPNSSLGQSIANIGGVYQSGSGVGISKPVIRGLSGSRVVTFVNGLRIENQQWGADHGLPITDLGIGSVEVIKGPASLLYGADALGGVLYFVDEPYALNDSYEIFVRSQFESNTLGTMNKAGIKFSKKAFRINVYGAYDNHADLYLPNGTYLVNSRFNQASFKSAIGYRKKKWVMNARYNFYQGNIGIIGDTEDSIVTPQSFQTSVQDRSMATPFQFIRNNFLSVENKFFLGDHELNILVGNTNNRIQEYEESTTEAEMDMNLNNSVYNLRWKIHLWDKLDLIVGSQGMLQYNSNSPDAEEQLIPDAQTLDVGGFVLAHAHMNKWRFQLGGRIDQRQVTLTKPFETISNFQESYTGFNTSTGFAFLGDISTIRFNISTGFRAPNFSELLSDGVHHGSIRYEKGNPNLTTEQALQFDASYALNVEHAEFFINPFYNRLNNYIYLSPSDSTIDGFQVFNYVQAPFAQIYGGEAGFHYHPHRAHWFHIESSFSTVFAEDDNKTPLALIPQSRVSTQFKVEFNMDRKFRIQNLVLQHLYYLQQNRLAYSESYSPDYHLINLGINMKVTGGVPLEISLGVKNLLNQQYYDHLSALKRIEIPNPGINGYIALRLDLKGSIKKKPD
ncbi:MAG: TonB-dependent receptor [Crocinitomicaceae bacterium]|nr:TonB-dependent receptor [Crocinitomicaceae bacterium]